MIKINNKEIYYNRAINKAKNEINKTYNSLTIIDIDYKKTYESYLNEKYYRVFVITKCICGKISKGTQLNAIKNGHIKSCGCLKFNNPLCVENLIGKTFGRLTVISRDLDRDLQDRKSKKHIRVHWLCQCSCGNEKLISATTDQLKLNRIKSCGCFRSEQLSKRNKDFSTKHNKFIHQNNGTTLIFDENNNKCMIDTEDFDIISKWYWRKVKKRGNLQKGYWVTNAKKENDLNKAIIMLHQIVAKIKYGNYNKKQVVDHLSRNTDDNRKCNILLKTNQKNSHNRGLSKSNTSGKTGVSFSKQQDLWQVYITVNYKTIRLGYFINYEDAVNARKKAEIKYGFTCDDKVSDYDYNEETIKNELS